MLFILLGGAVLVGLLTATGPYIDSKGMEGCSNIYMLSKGICMTAVLFIGASFYCTVRGINLSDVTQPSRLGAYPECLLSSFCLDLAPPVKRYGPGRLCRCTWWSRPPLFPRGRQVARAPLRLRDLVCLAGTGVLLYLLYEGRPQADTDPDARLF